MMNIDALSTIKERYESLSPKSKIVAEYILNNPQQVVNSSITELAQKTDVSPYSVLSCVRSLGYDGFSDFKISLALSLNKSDQLFGNVIVSDDSYSILIKTCQAKAHYINDVFSLISEEEFDEFVDKLASAKKVGVFGLGFSAFAAEYLSVNLMRLGYSCIYYRDPFNQLIESSLLGNNDVAVVFSSSGTTEPIISAIKTAKNNGCITAAITCHPKSQLTQYADYTLLTTYSDPVLLKKTNNSILEQITVASAITLALANKDVSSAVEMFTKTTDAVQM